MILVIEGCIGVGKTTLAKEFCARQPRVVNYKPFQRFGDARWATTPGQPLNRTQQILERLGVPYNSVSESIFLADFLAKFKPDVVLDQSVVSGIANAPNYIFNPEANWLCCLDYWQELLAKCDVRYVWLDTDYGTAASRSSHVGDITAWHVRRRIFEQAFDRVIFQKIRIDVTPDTGDKLERLLDFAR